MTEHDDLETRVHRALRGLPAPRAPRTLLPAVMAAVARGRRAQPWYERAWLTWPLGWKMASLAAVAVLLTGLAAWEPEVASAGRSLALAVAERLGQLTAAPSSLAAVVGAADVLRRALLAPILGCLVLLVGLASMTCAATGALLLHVTSERMSG